MVSLTFFALGAIFGACCLASRIVAACEWLAFKRGRQHGFTKGFERGWGNMAQIHNTIIQTRKDTERAHNIKSCRRISFGKNGNLKRWEPITK